MHTTLSNQTLNSAPPSAAPSSPVSSPEAPAPRRSAPTASESARRPRVLVVEDDADIMRCLSIRLQINGFDVSGAGDLQSALDLAGECDPDVAVFDISFPGGDGIQLTQKLRESPATAKLPVMVLTASMRPGIEEEALAAGANGFMRKPYDANALVQELVQWCQQDDADEPEA